MPVENQPPEQDNRSGPVRTLRVGDRITVYGDLEVDSLVGRRIQVRVYPASSPVMFPAVQKPVTADEATRFPRSQFGGDG